MDDKNKQTDGAQPGQTAGTPPAATPPQGAPAATVDPSKVVPPEGYELIRTEDKKNLISQRDKANNSGSEDSALLNALLQKDAVKDAVASPDFQEKYPDVTVDELLEANPTSDDEIAAIAAKRQARYEKIKQDHIAKVQSKTGAPELTPEDRDKQLKEISGPNRPKGAFQRGLQLMRAQVK